MQEKLSEVALIMVGSTLIILVLAGLIVISLFISQKRKFRYRQDLADLKNNYEREVLKTQLETQSETFESVSRELHDNVGTLISIALVHLHSTGEIKSYQKSAEVTKLLEEAMDTLRDISKSINPDSISKIGLGSAIAKELEKIEKTNLFKTSLHIQGEELVVEPSRQIILFRIVQEALNNSIKHSGGNRIMVAADFTSSDLIITIQDNGNGFNPPAGNDTSGLINMKKRAALINAKLEIGSNDKGTLVSLQYCNADKKESENPISMV